VSIRPVKRIVRAQPTMEGAGVRCTAASASATPRNRSLPAVRRLPQ
jgi:hypothetical protein